MVLFVTVILSCVVACFVWVGWILEWPFEIADWWYRRRNRKKDAKTDWFWDYVHLCNSLGLMHITRDGQLKFPPGKQKEIEAKPTIDDILWSKLTPKVQPCGHSTCDYRDRDETYWNEGRLDTIRTYTCGKKMRIPEGMIPPTRCDHRDCSVEDIVSWGGGIVKSIFSCGEVVGDRAKWVAHLQLDSPASATGSFS